MDTASPVGGIITNARMLGKLKVNDNSKIVYYIFAIMQILFAICLVCSVIQTYAVIILCFWWKCLKNKCI